MEAAKQQLTDFIRLVEEKNQMRERLTAGLLSIKGQAQPGAGAENLNWQLAELAGTTLLTHADWQDFQQRFEKVYPGFFANLAVTVPGITPAKERMMALLKLNISYRQMASMLGIAPKSVRVAKYRLRKKLAATAPAELISRLDDPNVPGQAS